MPTPRTSLALVAIGILSLTGVAHADVAPPDACTSVGEPCDNAGPNGDQAGTCQASTCTRATPSGPTTYDCNLCVVGGAGGGGGGGGGAGAGAAGNAGAASGGGSAEPKTQGGGGGCAVSATSTHHDLGTWLVGLGLVLTAFRRRR